MRYMGQLSGCVQHPYFCSFKGDVMLFLFSYPRFLSFLTFMNFGCFSSLGLWRAFWRSVSWHVGTLYPLETHPAHPAMRSPSCCVLMSCPILGIWLQLLSDHCCMPSPTAVPQCCALGVHGAAASASCQKEGDVEMTTNGGGKK